MTKTTLSILAKSALAAGLMASFTACQKPTDPVKPDTDPNPVVNGIPAGFSFATTDDVSFQIKTLDNADKPMRGIRLSVFSLPERELVFTGATGANGLLEMRHTIGKHITQLEITTDYPGLPNSRIVDLTTGKAVNLTLGGSAPVNAGGRLATNLSSQSLQELRAATNMPTLQVLGTWNNSGLPNYLELPNELISQAFRDDITTSLPERQALSASHRYLSSTAPTTLNITELADVWVTFVHEGAGYLNTLGFYTFDPANPPTSVSQIQNPTVIFPNASFYNSGGALYAGNKVKLGRFPAGTGIGFFILADAFRNGQVGNGLHRVFSHNNLNPETDASLRRHVVLLDDTKSNRFLLAFEDMRRDAGSDNDFNDAIYFVTSNPVTAIDPTGMPAMEEAKDTDNDGVIDVEDEYPTDPKRAFNVYTPSKTGWSTLVYEDQWPNYGDFDFNDLVMNYNFQEVTNAQNQIVDIKGKFRVKAIGASFRNGWGFELPVLASNVESTTGSQLSLNYTGLAANGVERNATKAIVVAFDNAFDKLQRSVNFANTVVGEPVRTGSTFNVNLTFTNAVSRSTLGSAPYNPFLIVNTNRGREVHLPNYRPTERATWSMLGTGADKSNPAQNIFYKDNSGLPWALHLPVDFDYPAETKSIIGTHLKFKTWAESGGSQFTDWYQNKTNYRNTGNIFR